MEKGQKNTLENDKFNITIANGERPKEQIDNKHYLDISEKKWIKQFSNQALFTTAHGTEAEGTMDK